MDQGSDEPVRDSPIHFLVMELVEGEDLQETIERGPMTIDEALPVALQIAEALEGGNTRRESSTRDLKPANVKLTSDRKVKVLDFGLAKALDPASLMGNRALEFGNLLSMSPTLTAQMTQAGVILGTASYMAPEAGQRRGSRPGEQTSGAFGVVLYEMLTRSEVFRRQDRDRCDRRLW